MTGLQQLEAEIEKIKQRNKNVEADKPGKQVIQEGGF